MAEYPAPPRSCELRCRRAHDKGHPCLSSVKLPCLKEDEHEDAPPQNTNPEETSQMTFSAMSFQRRSLTDSVEKFMAGLLNCYKDKGLDFTQADGTVWLGKEKHQWKDIVSRVPAYFLQILKDVQGWRFSSQVHNQLMQLLPKRRDNSKTKMLEWLRNVVRVAPTTVTFRAQGPAPFNRRRVILFVNAISSVQRLSSVLSLLLESPSASKVLSRVRMSNAGNAGPPPGPAVDVLDLHSKMRQKDRLKRIERFRKLKDALLVCTDIAARGLDVPDVSAVLHFQAPRGSEVFVHRSGRTARAGRAGETIAFVSPNDIRHWGKVYQAVGVTKERVEAVPMVPEAINAAKEASRLAADLEKKVHQTSKANNEKSWLRRAAEEADLVLEEGDEDLDRGRKA
ncbi:DDX24, partial [Symbiodinium natans]